MSKKPTRSKDWYHECVKPHEPMVRHWISSRYGEYCDVKDVMQESLLKLFEAKKKGEIESPKAFLFAIARNVAVSHIRKSKVRMASSIHDESIMDIIDEDMCILETVARNQELEILTRAIQALPDRCRKVFTLSKVYGMSCKSIATELGISPNTVTAQIANGLIKCKNYMERNCRQ